jgi:hypothetical protein
MATKVGLEPCSGQVRPTPEVSKLIQTAASKLGPRQNNPKQLPVPVQEFLADAEALVIVVWGCIKICIFGYCLFCCYSVGAGKPWGMCEFQTEGKL